MTLDPPVVATKAWKVQMGSLLSVSVEGGWYRGLAVSRLNQNFSIYLVDFGRTVTATQEALRPLTCLLDIPEQDQPGEDQGAGDGPQQEDDGGVPGPDGRREVAGQTGEEGEPEGSLQVPAGQKVLCWRG